LEDIVEIEKLSWDGYFDEGLANIREIKLEKCWLLRRDYDEGGVSGIIVGPSRSGKTTFIANLVRSIMKNNPDELIFWRGIARCQWTYFKLEKVRLLLSTFQTYEWGDKDREGLVEIADYVAEVRDCTSARDFLDNAKPGYVNVFYMPNWQQLDFLLALSSRLNKRWITVVMDEVQEIVPPNTRKPLCDWIAAYCNTVGQLAKNQISYICATQSYPQVDYQLRAHMLYWVFMPHARVPSKGFLIKQGPLLTLPKGWCIIEGKEGFRRIHFYPCKHHADLVVHIRSVEAMEHEEAAPVPAAAGPADSMLQNR